MSEWPSIVYVIDDERSVREALSRLLRSAGLPVQVLSSAVELFELEVIEMNACIISDICMPKMSGLEIPALLAERDLDTPVIFVTAVEDEEARIEAARVGSAVFFKPVDGQDLLDAISAANLRQ